MQTYNVIEVSTGKIVASDLEYEYCVMWINNYGNIIDYTIVPNNI